MTVCKIEAFKHQVNSGKMQHNKIRIYNLILKQPTNIATLREITGMPHQTLTSVLSLLESLGWVYRTDTIKVNERSYTLYVAETDIEKAKSNAMIADRQKFIDWCYRGEKNNWFKKYQEKVKEELGYGQALDTKGNGYTP